MTNGKEETLRLSQPLLALDQVWHGAPETLAFDEEGIRAALLDLSRQVFVVRMQDRIGVSTQGRLGSSENGKSAAPQALLSLPALPVESLGSPDFKAAYGARYAYYAGSMANGIASEEMVIALGKEGFLGSFGAAGLTPPRIESAIQRIQQELGGRPYAFNLIHSPNEPALEQRAVELYLKYGVRAVEASAFLDLTPAVVRYRAAGLELDPAGQVVIRNRIIAKLSRREVALKFMQPAPAGLLNELREQNLITEQQAALAQQVPLADDITAEADSGGHTDNRPLVCLLPSLMALRDEIQARYCYRQPLRVGAAGGISTPASALAALMMGAAYVVTGSVNQSCVEAGASPHTRGLLAEAGMADVMMAPSADMFEMGVRVQLLKRGTLFPLRAQKLYELYTRYDSLEEMPAEESKKLQEQVFRREFESIWTDTVKYFSERDPRQIERAQGNPKRKMALVFRWYLGLSSRWSNSGEQGREMDYQIWCGPAMGAFNDWARGSYLFEPQNRRVVDVARHILTGCAYLYRLQSLKLQGLLAPASLERYYPERPAG